MQQPAADGHSTERSRISCTQIDRSFKSILYVVTCLMPYAFQLTTVLLRSFCRNVNTYLVKGGTLQTMQVKYLQRRIRHTAPDLVGMCASLEAVTCKHSNRILRYGTYIHRSIAFNLLTGSFSTRNVTNVLEVLY